MKTMKDMATGQLETHPKHLQKRNVMKLIILAIPALVLLVGSVFPLREVYRQALVCVTLLWFYAGAMIGLSLLG